MCISFFNALQQFGDFSFWEAIPLLIIVFLVWILSHFLVAIIWCIIINVIAWMSELEVDEGNAFKLRRKKSKIEPPEEF